jgi:hypothetical protein
MAPSPATLRGPCAVENGGAIGKAGSPGTRGIALHGTGLKSSGGLKTAMASPPTSRASGPYWVFASLQ